MKRIYVLTSTFILAFSLTIFSQGNSNKVIKNGLVAYYQFDGDFSDHSGNGYHATNMGAGFTSGRNGQANTALLLNGSNSGVRLDNGYPKIFGGSLTISAWVYFNDDNRAIIFGSYDTPNNFSIEKHTGKRLRLWWNNGQRDFYSPTGAVSLKTWHLVSFVRDKAKDKFYIYVDGKEVANFSGTGTDVIPAGPFYIGRDVRTGSTVMNGRIDDLQINNRALSSIEISSLYSPASVPTDDTQAVIKNGLASHYTFDGDFNDYSGNGFHTTNIGASFTSGRNGQANTALLLNGSNSGVRLDKGYPKIFGGSLTISAWVYFNDDNRAIIFGSYDTPYNFSVEKHTGKRLRLWWNNGQRDFYSPTGAVSLKTWHLVSFVRDKAKDKFYIYVDGKEVANFSGTGTDVIPAGPFYIGRDVRTGSTVMNGRIDDVQIYNRALSGQEIRSLYSN